MSCRDMRPVQPIVANSGSRAEVEMRFGDWASCRRMPMEGENFTLIRIHEGVVVADGDDFPQTICINVFYDAIEKDQTEVNSSNSWQSNRHTVIQRDRVRCERGEVSSSNIGNRFGYARQ